MNITFPQTDQIIGVHEGYTQEICHSADRLEIAYQLRYRAYLAAKAVSQNNRQMIFDEFDEQPNSMVHLIWYQGNPVASIRSCIFSKDYDWAPTEAVQYFPEAIEEEIGKGQYFVESNRMAVDPSLKGRQSLFAQMLLFRVHALNSAVHNCGHIITAVREKHVPFYQRFLGMQQISQKSRYIPWADAYVVLMACKRAESMSTALKKGLPPVSKEDISQYKKCLAQRYRPSMYNKPQNQFYYACK